MARGDSNGARNARVDANLRTVWDSELPLSETDAVRRIASWQLPGCVVIVGELATVDAGPVHHRDPYLVSVAVDPADPDAVIVSATDGPGSAYWPRSAEAYVYRKTRLKGWEQAMSGLAEAKGTTASRFATHVGEPGVIYAANNRGLFRSDDAGRSWKALDLPWPEPGLADGVEALACLPEG